MSASLVGSEMCIRDSPRAACTRNRGAGKAAGDESWATRASSSHRPRQHQRGDELSRIHPAHPTRGARQRRWE
eukprot:12332429-Alexandrium_andersonii.AAC.1